MPSNNDDQRDGHRDNYVTKNEPNTDSADRQRNNNGGSYDDNDILDNIDALKTTDTEMLFDLFANKDKMVNESEIKHFKKPDNNSDHRYSDSDRYDKDTRYDDKDTYTRNDHDKSYYGNDKSYDYKDYDAPFAAPQASKYGPSYGPSYGDDDKYDDSRNDRRDDSESEEFKTKEDLMLGKLEMLRKLGEQTQSGVKLSQNYNMNSDIQAMRYEYELHKSIRDKHNGVRWMNNMMLNMCYGVELANENFNPFDFHLDGWSTQMEHDSDGYYDVFGELYEKYFKSGKPIPPELKLFFMIGGSAMKFHAQHTIMSKIPNMGDMLNRDPAMVEKLRQKAANDKMREQRESTRQSFDNSLNREHDMARQQVADIDMIRRYEQQDNLQQQIYNKQNQLKDLQNQLNMQMSDTRSYSSGPQEPQIPYEFDNMQQKTIRQPMMPPSLANMNQGSTQGYAQEQVQTTNQEMVRQHFIMNHKKMLQEEEMMRKNNDQMSHDGSSVKISPDLEKIIGDKFKGDSYSKISEGSSLDGNDLDSSDNVVLKKRGRRKKNSIKIDT